jgi:hypothetical protein
VVSLLSQNGISAVVQPTAQTTQEAFMGVGSTLDVSTSNLGLLGASSQRDVFFPTQDLVVLTRTQPGNVLTAYVSRGLSEIDVITGPPGSGFDLDEVRFGTPGWERVFEGTVQRVKVWDDQAIDLAAVETERTTATWPAGCGLGFEVAPILAALQALRARKWSRRAPARRVEAA